MSSKLSIQRRKKVFFYGLCIVAGVQHATVFGTQAYGLPLGEATTPQYLKSLGYRTHGVGKVKQTLLEVEKVPVDK